MKVKQEAKKKSDYIVSACELKMVKIYSEIMFYAMCILCASSTMQVHTNLNFDLIKYKAVMMVLTMMCTITVSKGIPTYLIIQCTMYQKK